MISFLFKISIIDIMYNNIQNVACIELFLDQKDNRFKFSKDILSGKNIQSIFLIGQGNDYSPISPFTGEKLSEVSDVDSLSLFLNLFDTKGNLFVKNFLLSNVTNSFDNFFPPLFFFNRYVDIDKSYISILNNDNVYYPVKLLMYVTYCTKQLENINRVITGTKTIQVQFSEFEKEKKLSDLINFDLQSKKIKKITYHPLGSDLIPMYFDIVCKNGYRLENVPMNYLKRLAEKEIYLNNLIIDPENSYIRFANENSLDLRNYISFIY